MALAQPLLDLFGDAPHLFVLRGAEGVDVVLFAVTVVLAPPAVLWLAELAVGAVAARSRSWLHGTFLALLAWAVVVQLARPLASGAALMVPAALAGAGFGVLALRATVARLWLSFAAVAPLVFVLLFLLASPSARLIGGDRVGALGAPIGSPAPVVMIVLDELPTTSILGRDGTVDPDIVPNLADLAADALWFRNATTVSNYTWHAVPSLLTGMLPRDGTTPLADDHPQNLFTLLGAAYDLNVTESITRLCPTDLCATAPADRWDLLGDAMNVMRARLSWSGDAGDVFAGLVEPAAAPDDEFDQPLDELPTTERFVALLDGISDDPLALHYLHVLLPHQPFRYLPSGRTYERPAFVIGRDFDNWGDEEWPVALGRQRHLLQLRYTDALVGRVLDRLRALDLYDDALIVLTSDHGIAFRPGHPIRGVLEQTLTDEVLAELLWVPLLVKLPGQSGGEIVDDNVLLTDVLPTIAEVLDVGLPSPVDGRSVLSGDARGPAKPFRPSRAESTGIAVGDELEIDGTAGLRTVLGRAAGHFLADPGEPGRLWRVGPSSSLVGTSAADLPTVEVELPDAVRHFDPADGTAPALVRGHARGVQAGEPIAVAVNGVVAATGVAFVEGDRVSIAAIVDDHMLRPGANEITVHRIEP